MDASLRSDAIGGNKLVQQATFAFHCGVSAALQEYRVAVAIPSKAVYCASRAQPHRVDCPAAAVEQSRPIGTRFTCAYTL